MATAPFPVDPVLTGISLAYKNRAYIADEVLPRITPPLEKQEFTYHKFRLADGFTLPDTKVGRKGVPAEIEFASDRLTGKTEDYGLDDVIPNDDFDNAPMGYDPAAYAVESLTDLVLLDREKRVADLVFAAATYPVGNKATLSGTGQWSDFVNSNPIDAITGALDTPVMRPNVMVIGRLAWSKLIQHPRIVKATYGDATDAGIARKRDVAELFELEDILVGESFVNSAKKGQAVSLVRCWGKHCALLHRNRLARPDQGRITFGYTAQFKERVSGRMDDPKQGLRGSVRVRVGESVDEVISANDVAYFFENAVA